mgnify:CR=1 FL=1
MGTLGIGCGGFGFGMKTSPASDYGGYWFGFEVLCASLLARKGMNHPCYFYEVRSKRTYRMPQINLLGWIGSKKLAREYENSERNCYCGKYKITMGLLFGVHRLKK